MPSLKIRKLTRILPVLLVGAVFVTISSLAPLTASADPSSGINDRAARKAVRAESKGSVKIGYAMYTSSDGRVAGYRDGARNYGASITKSMILVAYLNQLGAEPMSSAVQNDLTSMIQSSDNDAANRMYNRLHNGRSAIKKVARDANMTHFRLNTKGKVYVLGQSQITARDFSRFFANIDSLITTAGNRSAFGMRLLANVSPQSGILDAGLPGTIYSKEGWKPQPDVINPFGMRGAPYVVNQAAQFTHRGQTYGLAVTVAGTSDQASGEAAIKRVTDALIE